MVKLNGPLMSLGAHGKLANELNYSKRKDGNIGRKFHYPRKDPTGSQYTRRVIIGLLTAHWQTMSAGDKATWEANAKSAGLNISGFNYFVKLATADLYTHHGLCGYWSFNEPSGETVLDYSGRGHTGTLKPTYPGDVPVRVASKNKELNNALLFTPLQYVNCGQSADFDLVDAITIMAWIKPTDANSPDRVVAKQFDSRTTAGSCYQLGIFQNNFRWAVGGVFDDKGDAVVNGVWNHICGTYDRTNAKRFFNGREVWSSAYAGAIRVNNAQDLTLGISKYDADVEWNYEGTFDEVRIYNRALPAAEIKKQYELMMMNKKRQPTLVH